MSLEKIRNQLYAEIDIRQGQPGDVGLYSILLNIILDGDTKTADSFMLSKVGGYTKKNLESIKRKYELSKRRHGALVQDRAF